MITPNPIIGTGLHAVGGISASTCYIPFNKTKKWSWESYWLVQAAFAWLIMPLVIGFITVPQLFEVLQNSPTEALVIPFILGAIYGFGGMSFGYAIRHIGFSLTYTISIGISAVLGTITPLFLNGTLLEHFQKPGGLIVLGGLVLEEWKHVKSKTYARLIIALITLIISFVIMSYGSVKGEESGINKEAEALQYNAGNSKEAKAHKATQDSYNNIKLSGSS